jgi:hypothetical protein
VSKERKNEVHGSEQLHAGAEAFHGGYVSALGKRNDQWAEVHQSHIDEAANDNSNECSQEISYDGCHVLDTILSI